MWSAKNLWFKSTFSEVHSRPQNHPNSHFPITPIGQMTWKLCHHKQHQAFFQSKLTFHISTNSMWGEGGGVLSQEPTRSLQQIVKKWLSFIIYTFSNASYKNKPTGNTTVASLLWMDCVIKITLKWFRFTTQGSNKNKNYNHLKKLKPEGNFSKEKRP